METKGSRGPGDSEARRRAGLGAIAGVLAAGTALGVGQLVAGLTGANGSPVVAVGQLQIDFTPPWLKNFAISEFGSDDKLVLVSGILVVLGIFAAVIGVAATRRLAYGMAGLVVFGVIGLTAAATRPTATAASLLPTLAATAAAAIVLRVLIDRVGPGGGKRAPCGWTASRLIRPGGGTAGRCGPAPRVGRPGPACPRTCLAPRTCLPSRTCLAPRTCLPSRTCLAPGPACRPGPADRAGAAGRHGRGDQASGGAGG